MNQSEASSVNPDGTKICPQCGATLPAGALDGLCPACLLAQGVTAETAADTAPFQPPTVEEVARLFPQLEILGFIGKGGMGAVYKARQPALDRLVALKILPPQVASGPAFTERFNREARALARLSHPNIVAVHEFGQVNGLPFFIMEFVDGLNLRQLERTRKLSAREALQIVPQICEALQFAHDEGIVHRDIKPDNILIDKRGRVKIADFGIAKLLGGGPDTDLTATQGILGTPNYMAPEQVEKPESVDHRADIFALGVVFYEMLTGELPLGKFAPPSSGRMEVDVRLDEVVLRALEKKPELRYQQASQVKTAVETIASAGPAGGGPATAPPPPKLEFLLRDALAQDYRISIRSCVRRGWGLVRGNFWPLVGISALIWVLLAIAHSAGVLITSGHDRTNGGGSVLGLLVSGPLIGGLYFFFLQKLRGQPVAVETAFAGFSSRFLHLFLGSFVSFLLTGLGFLCLILPGIYLWVAWTFTLPLIIDKRLEFWSAMELSRKVVGRHWWKLFALVLVLALLHVVGFFAFCVGILVAAPIATASLMYAYEDIFGQLAPTSEPTAGVGPHGTAVVQPQPAGAARGSWSLAKVLGLAVVACILAGLTLIATLLVLRQHARVAHLAALNAQEAADAEASAAKSQHVFGPVVEPTVLTRASGSNQFLDLDTGKLATPPTGITKALVPEAGEDEDQIWKARDIADDSPRHRYVEWLQSSGSDLLLLDQSRLVGFDLVFTPATGPDTDASNPWDELTPDQVVERLTTLDGTPPDENLLSPEQTQVWLFRTRAGAQGVLQLMPPTGDTAALTLRYKLVKSNDGATTQEYFEARLEAAQEISGQVERDAALGRIACDVAAAGEARLVSRVLNKMMGLTERDQAALECVRLLAKRGMRKPAVEIAKAISGVPVRDTALSELAQ